LTLNEQRILNISVHNAKVRENREILKDLINVHYFPAKQQLAFCSNDESSISSNRGNYVEFYILLLRKMTTQIKQEFRLMCGLCDIEAIFKKNWLLEVLLLMKQTLSD